MRKVLKCYSPNYSYQFTEWSNHCICAVRGKMEYSFLTIDKLPQILIVKHMLYLYHRHLCGIEDCGILQYRKSPETWPIKVLVTHFKVNGIRFWLALYSFCRKHSANLCKHTQIKWLQAHTKIFKTNHRQ